MALPNETENEEIELKEEQNKYDECEREHLMLLPLSVGWLWTWNQDVKEIMRFKCKEWYEKLFLHATHQLIAMLKMREMTRWFSIHSKPSEYGIASLAFQTNVSVVAANAFQWSASIHFQSWWFLYYLPFRAEKESFFMGFFDNKLKGQIGNLNWSDLMYSPTRDRTNEINKNSVSSDRIVRT